MATQTQTQPIYNHNTTFFHLSAGHPAKRILLVDNQAHVLRVMKSALDRSGYEVETTMSADMALSLVGESHFDILIIDNGLEKLDGQQLICAIEDRFGDRAPAMFLLTDHNVEFLQQWCSKFDRTECLEKPISISYLDGRLNELFGE